VAAFTWPVRVYFEDTDSGGMVYHANHLRYFERARTEWLRSMGFEQDVLREKLGVLFVVHSMNLRYIKPIRFNSLVHVITRLDEHRRASLLLEQAIVSEDNNQTYCLATARIACVDANDHSPRALPDALNAEMLHAS